MVQPGELLIDRRDGMRRRIYLSCLIIGIPMLSAVWFVFRTADPFVALAYPPYTFSLLVVLVGLVRRRMDVHSAERIVLIGTVLTYLSALAFGVWTAADLAQLRQDTTISSLLTITLMPMLAYVVFETGKALRVSLGILAAYVLIVGARLVPELVSGQLGGEVVEYLSIMVFLGTSVGLLHVLAQVKEQAAEARSTATAMIALANTDVLTGIANRRQLLEVLESRLAVQSDPDGRTAVILLDLDHFKTVNDTCGHDVGDAVLRQVAAVLTGQAGPDDLVGRWGGEEFLIIVPRTAANMVMPLAERCRTAVAAATIPEVGSTTVSIGVAIHRPDESGWDLLRRADDALYRAKAAGRDRVEDDDLTSTGRA